MYNRFFLLFTILFSIIGRGTKAQQNTIPRDTSFSIYSTLVKEKKNRPYITVATPKREEKKFGKHPTQKPLDLLRRIVLASTNKNDIVLDPFTGSSTTGLAAVMNGRKFVGIDNEKKYLDLSEERFKDLSKKSWK